MQDPLPNIKKHDLYFQCAVERGKSAVVDSANMLQVNWEVYFFSDTYALQKFKSNPLKYCGILTDPVTSQRFRPGTDSPTSEFNGRQFYFWSESSKEKFEMMPAYYSAPNIKMEELNGDSDSLISSH